MSQAAGFVWPVLSLIMSLESLWLSEGSCAQPLLVAVDCDDPCTADSASHRLTGITSSATAAAQGKAAKLAAHAVRLFDDGLFTRCIGFVHAWPCHASLRACRRQCLTQCAARSGAVAAAVATD